MAESTLVAESAPATLAPRSSCASAAAGTQVGKYAANVAREVFRIGATGLGREDIPNAEKPHDAVQLQALLAPALDFAQKRMAETHKVFSAESRRRAAAELETLAKLKRLHHEQLELSLTGGDAHFTKMRERQREAKASDIDTLFKEYQSWVSQTPGCNSTGPE